MHETSPSNVDPHNPLNSSTLWPDIIRAISLLYCVLGGLELTLDAFQAEMGQNAAMEAAVPAQEYEGV